MKKDKIMIVALVLLTIVSGISFGYFLLGMSVEGKGSLNTGKAAKLVKVTYDAGDPNGTEVEDFKPLTANNLTPGDKISKKFTIKIEPGTDPEEENVTYSIFMKIDSNTFKKCDQNNKNTDDMFSDTYNNCLEDASELVFNLFEINEDGTETPFATEIDFTGKTDEKVELKKITKQIGTETKTYTYKIELYYKDTQQDQNHNNEATFTGTVDVEFADKEG